MRRFEYKVMLLGGNMHQEKIALDEAGSEGWELVSVLWRDDGGRFASMYAYLKREKEDEVGK